VCDPTALDVSFASNNAQICASECSEMANATGSAGGFSGTARTLCKRAWWVFLISGIAGIAFGILALANPGIALFTLALFFAAWLFVDGIVNAIGGLKHRDKDGWWLLLLIGILGIVAGGYALLNPPVAMAVFVLVVAFDALLLGVLLLTLGWKIRHQTRHEWFLYVTGALSLLFGVLVLLNPQVGSVSIVWAIAVWAIATGVLKLMFAFSVRNLPDRVEGALAGAR
jgi:uncharacterized membrane protein HdeD (DUF308 family)